MNGDPSGYLANFQRGAVLRQHRRYQEAAEFLGKAIAADPENPTAYAELALCLNDWRKQGRKALGAIDRAISLDPNNAHFVGFKGWILVCQGRYKDALKTAKRAVAMAPLSIVALNSLANAYTKLHKWKMAETTARRILALNPNDTAALNLLVQALRFQGKGAESREIVVRILALVPNNAFGHLNAGYDALEVGDHLRAREHFLTSLQMNPHFKPARQGLLQALRAKLWLYRSQMGIFMFWMRLGTLTRLGLVLGAYFCLYLLGNLLDMYRLGWGNLFGKYCLYAAIAYSCVVYFTLTSGYTLLFFDPIGQRILTTQEKSYFYVAAALSLFLIAFFIVGCLADAFGC